MKKKSALSPRQCTVSQVNFNNRKTTWIARPIASATTLFSKSGPKQLLAVCRPQKNAPGREIGFQWRRDIGNWGIFWGQKEIVQQKSHRIVREMLESVYHSRRRICDELSGILPKSCCFLEWCVTLIWLNYPNPSNKGTEW